MVKLAVAKKTLDSASPGFGKIAQYLRSFEHLLTCHQIPGRCMITQFLFLFSQSLDVVVLLCIFLLFASCVIVALALEQ